MYQRIRDLREDADLSQRQLAEILHMHKPPMPAMNPASGKYR